MVWACVSAFGKDNLQFCEGTINAENYIEIQSNIYCHHDDTFSRDSNANSDKTMQNHILLELQKLSCVRESAGAGLACP